MIDYKALALDDRELVELTKLFRRCFPESSKFSVDYLRWLYIENPRGKAIGFNAVFSNKIIAHYSCIPVVASVFGERVSGLLSLNTATDANFRGQGLFKNLANKTFDLASDLGFKFVYGVANQNSTPTFISKLQFTSLGSLDVRVGVGNFYRKALLLDSQSKADFFIDWDECALDWRVRNPANRLFRDDNILYGRTPYWTVVAQGGVLQSSFDKNDKAGARRFQLGPSVSLGQLPRGVSHGGLYAGIPSILRPSPLNLIFKDIGMKSNDRLNIQETSEVFLSFVDFDAF